MQMKDSSSGNPDIFATELPKYMEGFEKKEDNLAEVAVIAKKTPKGKQKLNIEGKEKQRENRRSKRLEKRVQTKESTQKRLRRIQGLGKGLNYKHGLLDNLRANNKTDFEDFGDTLEKPELPESKVPILEGSTIYESEGFKGSEVIWLREEKSQNVDSGLSLFRRRAAWRGRNVNIRAA